MTQRAGDPAAARVERPGEEDGFTVHGLFERQVAQTPARVAAEHDGVSITYLELNARANRLAHLLRRRGVGPDVLVGLMLGRSIEMLVGLLGILKAGGAYVPLDPEYPAERVKYILGDASAPLLVADRQAAAGHSPTTDTVWLDPGDTLYAAESPENPAPVNAASDLAYVIYTSGSTGRPKGVQIPHKALVNFLRSMQRTPGITPDDVVAAVTTICFDIAGLELFLPLTVGARAVIVPHEVSVDGRRLSTLLRDSGVTLMQATPATWRLLLDAGWSGSKELTILCGGEAMPRELANALLDRSRALWNMYGPTETTVWSTVARVSPGDGPVPLGAPIDNTSLYIVDDGLQVVPNGVEGELCIGGDGVARGYLNRPDLTAERFIPDGFSGVPGARLYRTGDLARRLDDGTLLFGGRRDHQVKIRGYRIELGEIENVLLRDPDVGQAAVVAPEDQRGEKRLVACVVARAGVASVDAKGVRERLRGMLPGYMVPSRVIVLPAMPLTPNGKVDRKALLGVAPAESAEIVPPRDETEARLQRLWEEVLERSPISVDADFFDLGGDSLHAAALFARIARELGRDLPVAALVHAPTIERLASVLREGERATRWTSLVPFRTSGRKRPLFFVHGGAGTVLFMRELAASLDRERPVYGLQSEGQDGGRLVHDTIEKMAALYLREIRSVQPEGPYHIGGYCFGGTVAFEIARQLRDEGQDASFVGLVNAPCPTAGSRIVGQEEEEVDEEEGSLVPTFDRVLRRLRGAGNASGVDRVRLVRRAFGDAVRWRWHVVRSMRLGSRLASLGPRALLAVGGTLPKAWRPAYILSMTERAERRYRPKPYDGKVVVIRGNGLYRDPSLGWASLASSIEACAVGGTQRLRRDLIAPGLVPLLAEELGRRLDAADAEVEAGSGTHTASAA